ncbi:MAG: hypothetical protein ABL881_06620, partial [Novosphingobium sp.]
PLGNQLTHSERSRQFLFTRRREDVSFAAKPPCQQSNRLNQTNDWKAAFDRKLHLGALAQRLGNMNHLPPKPVFPELVEGLFFFKQLCAAARRKGQCFDKLSTDGYWVRLDALRLSVFA